MPCPTSFDCTCCPSAVMSCHARRCLTVRVVQGYYCHATPDIVRPCVQSKGSDIMPRPMSFHHVCCPKAVMSCHARRCRPCVLSKSVHVMPRPTSSDHACSPRAVMSCHARRCRPCVLSKGGNVIPRLISSDRVCRPKAVMACHARLRLTVSVVQRR